MRASELSQKLTIAALSALFCALQLYAFHWGVITPDTVLQYGQALTGRYDDWHPPVTAWLWRQLLTFDRGSAPFLILDSLLYWTGVTLIALILRHRAGAVAAALVLGFALLPIAFGEIGSILKDPLLACLLTMAAALILRREESEGTKRFWRESGSAELNRCGTSPLPHPTSQSEYSMGGRVGERAGAASAKLNTTLGLLALPFLLVASATRFNALFAAVPLLVLTMPVAWSRTPARMLAAALAAAALFGATGWLINDAMLQPHRSRPIFSLVNFDLAGIIAHGGANPYPSLGDAEAARLTAYCYDPRLYGKIDDEGCAPPEDSLVDYSDAHGIGAVAIWRKAVAAAPLPYLEHRLAHLNRNWRFLVADIPDDAVYIMSEPNDLGLRFVPNALSRTVGNAARIMAVSPLGRPISWLALAIGLLVLAPALPSRRFVTAIALSALFYGGGYAVVSVSSDLRYNLWTLIAVTIGLSVAFADWRAGRATVGKPRILLAAAPFAIVAFVESVALWSAAT